MNDVLIKFADLTTLNDALKKIVQEFDSAEKRADVLEGAIGDPYGRNDLREAVEDFEDRWDDKRDELRDGLKQVQEHVEHPPTVDLQRLGRGGVTVGCRHGGAFRTGRERRSVEAVVIGVGGVGLPGPGRRSGAREEVVDEVRCRGPGLVVG